MDRRKFIRNVLGTAAGIKLFSLEKLLASDRLWDDIYKKLVAEDAPGFIQEQQEETAKNFYDKLMKKYALQKSISSEELEKILIGKLPDGLWGTAVGENNQYVISGLETNGYKKLGSSPNPSTDPKICQLTKLTVNDGTKGWYYIDNLTLDLPDVPVGANPGDPTYITIKNPYDVVGVASPELTHTANGSRRQDIFLTINVVPVELSSFTAANVKDDQNDINLEWITASETNNYGFDIERSKDRINWEKIDFVKGNGTTSIENKYNLRDKDLQPGKYSYRLKQVDFDGSSKYSSILEALVKAPENFVLSQNYPNPFNPVTTITYQLMKDTKVNLTVYTLIGQEVKTLVDEYQKAGTYSIIFDTNNIGRFASGMYLYKLQTPEFRNTKRMILLK